MKTRLIGITMEDSVRQSAVKTLGAKFNDIKDADCRDMMQTLLTGFIDESVPQSRKYGMAVAITREQETEVRAAVQNVNIDGVSVNFSNFTPVFARL